MADLSHNDLILFLEKNRIFSFLTREEIIELLPLFERVKVPAGCHIFSQGEASDSLYVLLKGELISVLTKPSGATMVVGTINPVETVGELGVISGEPRSLTIEAVVDSELLKMPAASFLEFCNKKPAILAEISRFIVQRSLSTIKLMAAEKLFYNISIVYSLVKNVEKEALQVEFRKHLTEQQVTFLCTDEISTSEIKKVIEQSVSQNQPVVIFMNSWNEDLIKFSADKLTHFYLLAHASERATVDDASRMIMDYVEGLENLRLELILLHPDNTKKIVNSQKWLKLAKFHLHHHIRLKNTADFERLIRFMTGNAVVLVLGGGGARGLMHLGVIRAILDSGMPIDAIGGTSIGSSIGASYASTLSIDQATKITDKLKLMGIKSISMRNCTWPIISLFSSNPATRTLIDIYDSLCIEDLWIPYFAVSSNLSLHVEKVHREGLLWEAIRSSAAIPGIFPPVVFDNEILYDGGLLNNLPVDVMRKLIGPGHIIIASSLSRRDKGVEKYSFPPVLSLKQTILSKFRLGYRDYRYPPFLETFLDALLLGSAHTEEKNAGSADLLIKPNLTGFKLLSIVEAKEKELIGIGYRSAKEVLTDFQKKRLLNK